MPRRANIENRRYGMLTVVGYDRTHKTPSGQYKSYWHVICDCGNTKSVGAQNLRQGNTTSCGCQERGVGRSWAYKGKPTWLSKIWTQYKGGAAKRGYSFDLTMDQIEQLTQGACHYCGSPPGERLWAGKPVHGGMTVNGINRRVNSQGYNIFNCVPCCTPCNRMKMGMDESEFVQQACRIAVNAKR